MSAAVKLTAEQQEWLAAHPEFGPIGPPRANVRFTEWGTLYPDGAYTKSEPGQPIRLVAGPPYAVGVGRIDTVSLGRAALEQKP